MMRLRLRLTQKVIHLTIQYFGCHHCSWWQYLKEKKYYLENMRCSPHSPTLNVATLFVYHTVSIEMWGLQFLQLQNQYPLCSSDAYCKLFICLLLVFSFFVLFSYHHLLFLLTICCKFPFHLQSYSDFDTVGDALYCIFNDYDSVLLHYQMRCGHLTESSLLSVGTGVDFLNCRNLEIDLFILTTTISSFQIIGCSLMCLSFSFSCSSWFTGYLRLHVGVFKALFFWLLKL